MKHLLILLLSLSSFLVSSQEWETLYDDNYIPFPLSNSLSFLDNYYDRSFKINPYDSSIWMANREAITRFDKEGNFAIFDSDDHPNFDNFSQIYDIAFTSDYVFAGSTVHGIFRYDGTTWQLVSGVNKCVQLATDQDTIFMARSGEPFFIMSPSASYFGNNNTQKLVSKSGEMWASSGSYIARCFNNSTVYMNADTVEYLLDNETKFITFSPNTNDFYAAGEKGISIAQNRVFYDTITPYNTTGMPFAPVKEIAFDSQDNIWAVFGDPTTTLQNPISIGYLDRATATWIIYDATNSPLTQQFWTIEVDPCDNLWVGEVNRIHVLISGNCTQYQWLGNNELLSSKTSIYPNPSDGKITIETDLLIDEIRLLDLTGRELKRFPFSEEIELSMHGIFVLQLMKDGELVVNKKVIVE